MKSRKLTTRQSFVYATSYDKIGAAIETLIAVPLGDEIVDDRVREALETLEAARTYLQERTYTKEFA